MSYPTAMQPLKRGETMMRGIHRFFAANKQLCKRIEPRLPQADIYIIDLYMKVVAHYMNLRANQIIADVGGGKSCPFAKYRDPTQKTKIISVDTSESELEHNIDVDEKRVANVVQGLPFETEEVDLIVSSSVLEHLDNLDEFVANSTRSLKKGGYFIHLVPSKFAPFALINQALPHTISKKMVDLFRPEYKGICGFPAFYNDCYYSAIRRLLKKHNFEIVDIHLSYYQSRYFSFFAPLFLISALYEVLIQTLGAKDLCAYLLVIARKS